MPDQSMRKVWNRAELEMMDDAQLRAILREDASNQQGEGSDLDMVLCAMEILSERRRAQGAGKNPQVVWESFRKQHLSEEPVRPTRRKLARNLGAAAAALAIVVGCTVAASSRGFELFEMVPNWTKDAFQFECVNEDDGTGAVTHDPDEIRKLLPTWVPEGYVQDEYHLSGNDAMSIALAYICEDKTIVMGATEYLPGATHTHEKSDGKVEIYTSDGVDFYIFYNLKRLVAVWYMDGYDCFVGGNVSHSEMIKMIDSIQKE